MNNIEANKGFFNSRKPSHRYIPEHAIWFWTTATTKSSVTVVNDKYRYQVFNINTGAELESGYKKTLKEAKQRVFGYENRAREEIENLLR